jgi:hypothetical protein
MSHNMAFKKASRLTEVLERHVDLNRKHLQPRSIKSTFNGSPSGSYRSKMDVSVRHAFGGLTVLSMQYGQTRLKQYNNHRQTFRTEACANDVTELGLRKALENFGALRERLQELIAQYQKEQAVVLQTTCTRGELTALAKPGQVNQVTTPGIKLENERLMAMLAALPGLVHQPKGFRCSEVRVLVTQTWLQPYSVPQATYDLRKLRGKGLVARDAIRRLYRLTDAGMRVAVLVTKLREALLDPLLGAIRQKPTASPTDRPASPPDEFYQAITRNLFDLCEHWGLKAAA